METLTEENRMEILTKKPDLKHAFDVLDLYASDPDKRRELEERLRADKNYAYELAAKFEQGLEQGMEKGILKTKLENALRMKELGLSRELIEKSVGLSYDELKQNGIF
jgi:predicted transposase/invertase (TIGR01784 family)